MCKILYIITMLLRILFLWTQLEFIDFYLHSVFCLENFKSFVQCIQDQVDESVLFIGDVDSAKQWTRFIKEYLLKLSQSDVPRARPCTNVGYNLGK